MISNFGKIKSLSRKQINGKGFFIKDEVILIHGVDKRGYDIINLRKYGKSKRSVSIHILVAEHFLKSKKLDEINHKDGDKSNNYYDNLEWTTVRENKIHASLNGLVSGNKTSQYVGVCWDKSRNKWFASIKFEGKQVNLGRFINEIDAHNSYQAKLKEIDYGGKYR